jgi:hypothetical protein
MRRFRLLLILTILVVVVPGYKIYQREGIRNEHSALASGLPVTLLSSWTNAIKSPNKRIDVSDQYGIATIEGRWKKVSPGTFLSTTATINTVQIFCDRKERLCTETIAYVYSRSLDGYRYGAFQDGELLVIHHALQIREWSEDLIFAFKNMPVATLELRIFPKTQTVDRIYAEREDSSVFNRYVLE